MSHNLEHQKVHTRMVKEVLKAVARANNHPYQSVFTDFIAGHPSCTVCFWETFHKMYPDSPYEYGHCCKVSDEAAFCLIQRPYISKTLLTRRISPRGSP